MAAPKGNQFWKIRSKHGRDKLFASPQLMWEAAEEYFQWCINNPHKEIDFKGKDAVKVVIPKMRAFTLIGLCIYLDCSSSYFRNFKNDVIAGKRDDKEDFLSVITRIEEVIYEQKYSGAASGFLNFNIISRDIGLIDRQDITTGDKPIQQTRVVNIRVSEKYKGEKTAGRK